MAKLGIETQVVDKQNLDETMEIFRDKKITLPTLSQLSDPSTIPTEVIERLRDIDPTEAHPLNLYRINWYNDPDSRGFRSVPYYFIVPPSLTGVKAKIAVMPGAFFPMIDCHKVLAAYGCLAPRLVTGQFNPKKHRAIWPSTGNYCRGGVAVSRIMGCHGVAILPEEMSKERFDWLNKWVLDPASDIIKTHGCESNVKEIYDKCNELDGDADNIIFNQFCEFGNEIIHYYCTGRALGTVFSAMQADNSGLRLAGFTSATGSAGTIAAGDYLKDNYADCKIVAIEASECPTMLLNGFGGHNIQGIGDKHIPFIHNVMNTDLVAGISDQSTDSLYLLFNSEAGQDFLRQKLNISDYELYNLSLMGLSSICNVLAAIKMAKYYDLTENDVVLTVATDPAFMYKTEGEKINQRLFAGDFDFTSAAIVYGQHLAGVATDNLCELNYQERQRIFNLGYFTWVEQQGVSLEEFNQRKKQDFWRELKEYIPVWDDLIKNFNNFIIA